MEAAIRARIVCVATLAVAACDARACSGGGAGGSGSASSAPSPTASSASSGPATASASNVVDAPAGDSAAGSMLAAARAVIDDEEKARAKASADPTGFAWDLFVYVNWPALTGQRGVPDASQPFGADAPVVWATWKIVDDVYLAGGAKPDGWASGDPNAVPTLTDLQIDGTVLKDRLGNPVVYEERMNQGAFEYITSRTLYSFAGQTAARSSTAPPVAFPEPSMEIKASWRVLDAEADKDVIGHYLTKRVRYKGNVLFVGLTGLHVTSKALPSWFWATFEQVDDARTTNASLVLPIAPEVAASNDAMHTAFAGTRWQYYSLDGTQTAFVDSAQAPTLLANSQIETGFQRSSSCITCHALASIGPSSNPRFNFFQLKPGGMAGFVGAPPTAPFSAGGEFRTLDAVWSLRRAQ